MIRRNPNLDDPIPIASGVSLQAGMAKKEEEQQQDEDHHHQTPQSSCWLLAVAVFAIPFCDVLSCLVEKKWFFAAPAFIFSA